MSRFVPTLKTVWLLSLRWRLPRDIRYKLTHLVKRNIFDWESEQLRQERAVWLALPPLCQWQIGDYVEMCPAIPFPTQEDKDLWLQRVKLKEHKFLPPRKIWKWLYLL